MTKNEKRQIAELIGRVNDLAAGMARDWRPDAAQWEKELYWQFWDSKKALLQDEIKALTGEYIPIG